MHSYIYPSSYSLATASSASNSMSIAFIVALICAIIGSILIFVLFLRKDNEKKYTGFVKFLYDFLQFNKLCIDGILKFTYLFIAIFITVASFGLISSSFFRFLIVLIVGNLVLRMAYEASVMFVNMYENTKEIKLCKFRLYMSSFNPKANIINVAPDNISNKKYLILIFCPQCLHFPPRKI